VRSGVDFFLVSEGISAHFCSDYFWFTKFTLVYVSAACLSVLYCITHVDARRPCRVFERCSFISTSLSLIQCVRVQHWMRRKIIPISCCWNVKRQTELVLFWRTLYSRTHTTVYATSAGNPTFWMKTPLATEVDRGPDHIVLDGDPAPPRKGHSSPLFWPMSIVAMVVVAHLSCC